MAEQNYPNSPAARSAARFAARYAHRLGHTEAVADCPHCNLGFLAAWVHDVLGPQPESTPPPGPADPPNARGTR